LDTNFDFTFKLLSGSAFPATLAFQIRELERETDGDLKLDAIVTVVDAENFTGYEDTSPTAKMQASYTDIILIVCVASRFHSYLTHCFLPAE
jgi:G3E family GTPase